MSTSPKIPRLNGVIRAFEQGLPAFVTFAQADVTSAPSLRHAPYDGIIFELEHGPYDIRALADSLQYLLDRRQIAASGSLAPAVTPFARIPANGCEMSQWHAKQVLDMGVYGVMCPHVSTVEEARNAVRACRFPRPPGSPLYEPTGLRGDGPTRAATYWGLSAAEYYARADVWPLAPHGEVLVVIMCEEARGVKNLPDILREVPGIGAVVIGKGDLSQDLGRPREYDHPTVAGAIDRALAVCLEHKIPCGLPGVELDDVETLLKKGFRWLMTSPKPSFAALEKGRKLSGRG